MEIAARGGWPRIARPPHPGAKGGDVAVYASPDANAQPTTTLPAKTEYTLPASFLVFDQYQDWLHVYLPVRPNDATGWIKASDVTVSQPLEYQIKVSLADKRELDAKASVMVASGRSASRSGRRTSCDACSCIR